MGPIDQLEKTDIEGLFRVAKRRILDDRGSVMHMLRNDLSYCDGEFGEIYFSTVHKDVVKGWKLHKKKKQHFTVPIGEVKFTFKDLREGSTSYGKSWTTTLSPEMHSLLIVPPQIWYAFRGVAAQDALIVNVASHPHFDEEAIVRPLDFFEDELP